MKSFGLRTNARPEEDQGEVDVPAGILPSEGDEPHPNRHVVFAVVSIALFMASIDATIVATALKSINTGLNARLSWTAWTITAYSLGRVAGLPSMGRIGDQFGRRKIFLASIGVFTAASLACGLSVSIYMLVPLRFIQAVGGSAFMPSVTGIVSDHFGRNRDRAVGMLSSILPIGGVIGPILGGLFVSYWSWRGIFLVNVPIGLLLILFILRFVPHIPPKPAKHVDGRGIALMTTTILAVMFGITALGDGASVADARFLVPEVVGIVLAVLFWRHLKSTEEPVVPLQLLRGKGFGTVNAINILFGASALGFGALVPLYAQNRYNIPSLSSGTLLTARALGMVAIAGGATMVLRRTGYRVPMIFGFLFAALGTALMAMSPRLAFSPYGWLALAAGITGFGMGWVAPAAANAGMQLDPRYVGQIAGLRGTFRNIGSIMSIQITTAIIARSADPGLAQAHVFVVFAIVLVALTPLVMLVPDHRGSW